MWLSPNCEQPKKISMYKNLSKRTFVGRSSSRKFLVEAAEAILEAERDAAAGIGISSNSAWLMLGGIGFGGVPAIIVVRMVLDYRILHGEIDSSAIMVFNEVFCSFLIRVDKKFIFKKNDFVDISVLYV